MKGIFSILGLLLVVAVVGLIAKKQLGSNALPTVDGVEITKTVPGATPHQGSQNIQKQLKESVDAAMQQTRPAEAEK